MRNLVFLFFFISFMLSASAAEFTVFAAASLTDALKEIAADYQTVSGDKITFHFGGSSMLARQIEEGAPADVFISADEAKMDALETKGRIVKTTRKSLLSNTLVIVVASDSPLPIASTNTLASPQITKIALADPQAVPAGIYAKAYLTRIGLWNQISEKVVPTENVRAALSAVESGNVDAAIVYKTDAAISKKVKVAYEVALEEGPKISYPFSLVTDSKQPEAARKFLRHLESQDARKVFQKYGFLVPN